ncbi:glycosyltransferase family 4 protein [Candidatus Woesearchaeota archaeon]|nr:glycosyltransferase family 4 protein [Candidatus Woesearchaeota archaeon]
MKKIHLIREKPSKFGGAEVYLSRLSKALKVEGVEYQIVNSIFPSFLPSWLRIILFNFQVCLTKKNKLYFSLERIVCPDVYRAGDGVHKVFLNIENKSKLNPLHPIYLFLEKRCFNNAKFIIANSNMIKDEIIDTYGIRPNKIDVVYNGVESKTINHESSFKKLSKEFDIDKNSSILLYVGSGFKRKGVEEFLEIIAKLKNQSVKAFIIGKEKNLEYYQQLSKDLKIDKTVIFTGPRADVDDFYTISDIFLFPTRYEPFSNVVLEAMSFENAVFTTRQNGAHEILTDEYIMASSKDFSVAKKIDDLLEDAKELSDIKRENKLIASKLSIELNMQKTIEVINKV